MYTPFICFWKCFAQIQSTCTQIAMASCVPDADYASLSDVTFLLQVSQGTMAGTGVALVGKKNLDLVKVKLKK